MIVSSLLSVSACGLSWIVLAAKCIDVVPVYGAVETVGQDPNYKNIMQTEVEFMQKNCVS